MVAGVLIALLVAAALFLILRPYFLRYDNLVSFTGGLGAGKTFMAVQTALVLYRRQRLKVRIYNLFHLWDRQPLPELYSNIPLRITRKRYALRLTKAHLLLQEKLAPRSVCLLDEIDCFANQFQHDNPCIVNKKGGDHDGNFDEFCRFYRHYTRGGYLVATTQATANENLTIRRRQNTVITLFHFRTWGIPLIWPHLLYTVHARHKTLSDETTIVEEGNAEDNMRLVIGLMPWYRHYDTYCYSGRYAPVPLGPDERFHALKTNECLIAPLGKQPKLTTNTDAPPPPPPPKTPQEAPEPPQEPSESPPQPLAR